MCSLLVMASMTLRVSVDKLMLIVLYVCLVKLSKLYAFVYDVLFSVKEELKLSIGPCCLITKLQLFICGYVLISISSVL